MRWRTQLAVVGGIATVYLAGNVAFVRPVMDPRSVQRLSLASLEELVAREPENVVALRTLTQRYLDLRMPPRLVIDVVSRAPAQVQRDGRVSLATARAQEAQGSVRAASALANGALNRCASLPAELAAGAGCDVRVQTELALLVAALDRMIQWNVSPLTDPTRAELAHQIASHPIRIGPRSP
ncbi:MAG: hypothetical protein JNK05_23835 [Myxococcales bacterium]|nr:hypothetical protein [Myxococcales bacterium]